MEKGEVGVTLLNVKTGVSGITVIFNKLLPVTMLFLGALILFLAGQKDAAMLLLLSGMFLQLMWLFSANNSRR